MLNIDTSKFNELEAAIHSAVMAAAKTRRHLKITETASICGVSPSKISKFVKKTGFRNYKDYIGFIYGKKRAVKESTEELERIKKFLNAFDMNVIDKFFTLLTRYDKVILFGYGPSFLCAEYFEYKLKIITQKLIITVNEENTVKTLLNKDSLLVMFSTTGKFRSFSDICAHAREKEAACVLIVEEYNTDLLDDHDNVIFLTNSFQKNGLLPYEKSRAIFFIFIEVVMQRLIDARAAKDS